jgi:hypothetical protein
MSEAFHAGYHMNVDWPKLYIPAARQSVNSVYASMVNNGWRRQNLLGDYHFSPDTNELTRAGEMKVKWILTQAPPQHRTIYVQRGEDESQTAARIASIQVSGENLSPSVGLVQVNDTHLVAEGHPAMVVDSMFVSFQTNRPPPVLPAAAATSGE